MTCNTVTETGWFFCWNLEEQIIRGGLPKSGTAAVWHGTRVDCADCGLTFGRFVRVFVGITRITRGVELLCV